ncbi:MAG: NAD(P)H-hydrate epimerase [Candidatus Omnitrophota bacterium]
MEVAPILKSLPVAKIRELEKKAKDLGLEEKILIENASSNLFRIIDDLGLGKKVLVVAGRGNNGADVLSCARKLSGCGYNVKVVILEEKELGKEMVYQKTILQKLKLPVYSIKQKNIYELRELCEDRDFILEGILGIGVKGRVSPFLEEAITLINDSGKKIISCDIPSGLSPDEGIPQGAAIKADYTITFLALKQGFLGEGRKLCGKIFVVDIGISREALENLS